MKLLSKSVSKTVMLIDDDCVSSSLISAYLQHTGLRVVTASSGEEALHHISSAKEIPDLIFTDMVMPGIDGNEFLKELHEMPTAKKVPVIIISGLPNRDDLLKNSGAQGWVQKPLNLNALSDLIKKYLA